MKYIICDLDGTLYNVDHRLHLLQNCRNEEDYDKFHAEHVNDTINKDIENILYYIRRGMFPEEEICIFFITGRHKKFYKSTEKQLNKSVIYHPNYENDKIFMKSSYDIFTPDFIKDTLDKIFKEYGKENCMFVLDDRPATVKIYREAGLTCLQVKDSKGFIEDIKEK